LHKKLPPFLGGLKKILRLRFYGRNVVPPTADLKVERFPRKILGVTFRRSVR